MGTRIFSQQEIDNVFRSLKKKGQDKEASDSAELYDFRRPDRISKDQLRSLNTLYENFARSLASSLSAFLRQYVTVSVASLEQLSFRDFVHVLPTPTCINALGIIPYDSQAVLELGHSLIFPIFEMILGGKGSSQISVDRQVTEIERAILDGVFKIILHDLSASWNGVSDMEFYIDSHETQPALLQILSPNEAVLATSLEIRIGQHLGVMNIGFPSLVVHMLRQKFARQATMHRPRSTEHDPVRMLQLVKSSSVNVDARLEGCTVLLRDLVNLNAGDVIKFDRTTSSMIDLMCNGTKKFEGQIVSVRDKCAFRIHATAGEQMSLAAAGDK